MLGRNAVGTAAVIVFKCFKCYRCVFWVKGIKLITKFYGAGGGVCFVRIFAGELAGFEIEVDGFYGVVVLNRFGGGVENCRLLESVLTI